MYAFDFSKVQSCGSYVLLFKKPQYQKILKKNLNLKRKINFNRSKLEIFREQCKIHKANLLEIFNIHLKKKSVIGYGASARSSTLLNYLKLDNNYLKKVFDINPLKKNLYTPGTNLKMSFLQNRKLSPSRIIFLLAWNFKKEILSFLKTNGFKGKILQPLPKIKFFKLK